MIYKHQGHNKGSLHKKYNAQNKNFLHKHPKQQQIMKYNNKQQDVFVKESFFQDNLCDNNIPPMLTTVVMEWSTPNYFDLNCNDVLCGPRGSNLHHPGNHLLFLRLINANKEL
jgi:hypothetical protein